MVIHLMRAPLNTDCNHFSFKYEFILPKYNVTDTDTLPRILFKGENDCQPKDRHKEEVKMGKEREKERERERDIGD